MRAGLLLLSVLLACTVNKSDTGDDGGTSFGDEAAFTSTVGMSSNPSGSDTSATDPSMPTLPPTSEPDPVTTSTTLPPGSDLPHGSNSGDYLLAVSTVIQKDLPLQFYTTVEVTAPSLWNLTLQPLSLDIGKTGEPQQPVGEAIVFTDVPVVDGTFTLDFGELMISGQANPITGSDITATIVMNGQIMSDDFFCGDVRGMVTSPLMTSIDGSTFAAVRVAGLDALPAEITIDCAGDTVTDM